MAFLADVITEVRLATDEPATTAKYTDAILLGMISKAFAAVWNDINRVSQHPAVVLYDLSIVAGTSVYMLPATVGRIIDLQWISTAGELLQHFQPSSHPMPTTPGIVLDGNTIRFQTEPASSYTLRIAYVPSGFVHLHYGTITTALSGSITNNLTDNECVIIVDTSGATGTRDLRPEAYTGCVFRLLTAGTAGAGVVQDRLIRAYNPKTLSFTVAPAYTAAWLPAVSATYEVTPLMAEEIVLPVGLYVARLIIGYEGDKVRYATVNTEYNRAIRDARLRESHFEVIRGMGFNVATAWSPHVIGSYTGRIDSGQIF